MRGIDRRRDGLGPDLQADRARVSGLGFLWALVCNASVLAVATLAPTLALAALISFSVPVGVSVFVATLRNGRALVTPLTLYCAVWLIAVPLTAGPAPLMRAMAPAEVRLCALFGLTYCFVGLVMSRVPIVRRTETDGGPEYRESFLAIARIVLLISVAALAGNLALEGRIALFDQTSIDRKTEAQFLGFPLLASLGTISLCAFAYVRSRRRLDWSLALVYLTLQLLTGQRFVGILSTVLVIGTLTATRAMTRRDVRRVGVLALLLLSAFVFVAFFRGSAEDQYRFFISTGLYGGDPRLLQATEVVRYLGMSQRNLTQVVEASMSMTGPGEYTIAPITSLFGEPPAPLGTSTYGYTATNTIAYLYRDFGAFWLLATAAIAVVVNWAYRRMTAEMSFASTFIWAVCVFAMATSFFAYINAYIYWVLLFPFIATLIDRQSRQ